MPKDSVSIIIPACNEASTVGEVVTRVRQVFDAAEILVVDDGSTDDTSRIAAEAGARVIRHPYQMGNGAAVKTGARFARSEILIFMDADGQHNPGDIRKLLEPLNSGYQMIVGARGSGSQANVGRSAANSFYNHLASYVTGQRIEDLTSGFRAVRARQFREFLHLLPNGFSYPTTITMAFFRAGYPIAYVPITASRRTGKSHISPLRDGLRFLLIIFRIGTLYSPFKVFVPVSLAIFGTGLGYYLYTFVTDGRFTNMSALLFTTAVIVFMIGLVSEQITALTYQRHSDASED